MQQIFVVSDGLEEMAVREILPAAEVFVWDKKIDQSASQLFKDKEAVIWLNRQDGYRETADLLGKLLLRSAAKVTELVNEEEGVGFSPSESMAMDMNQETFSGWAKTVARAHTSTAVAFRPLVEDAERVDFLDEVLVDESVYTAWEDMGLTLSARGQPVCNVSNMVQLLSATPRMAKSIWFDEFAALPMTSRGGVRPWKDEDTKLLLFEIQKKLGLHQMTEKIVHDGVITYAVMNKINPAKKWLGSLSWDQKPRIENFFRDYMGAADTPFNRAASRNLFIALVARVYEPGCKVDTMVVLEGKQGTKKSSALKALGGDWFTECNETVSSGSNKDFLMLLRGRMIVEIAELDSFSKAETTKIKTIISTATDTYRCPYGRHMETVPRTSNFVGTTNEDHYLSDVTGARRFAPVRIGQINLEAIKRDRDQLFVEAVMEYRAGKSWWDFPWEEAEQVREARRRTDPWETEIASYLLCKEFTSVNVIAKECLKIELAQYTKREQMRIAHCLRALGWESDGTRLSATRERRWYKFGHDHGSSALN